MGKFDFFVQLSSVKTPTQTNKWQNIYIGKVKSMLFQLLFFHDDTIVLIQ